MQSNYSLQVIIHYLKYHWLHWSKLYKWIINKEDTKIYDKKANIAWIKLLLIGNSEVYNMKQNKKLWNKINLKILFLA